MLQKRLNHIAILHIYSESAENLDIEKLMNDFISKNSNQTLCQKNKS